MKDCRIGDKEKIKEHVYRLISDLARKDKTLIVPLDSLRILLDKVGKPNILGVCKSIDSHQTVLAIFKNNRGMLQSTQWRVSDRMTAGTPASAFVEAEARLAPP